MPGNCSLRGANKSKIAGKKSVICPGEEKRNSVRVIRNRPFRISMAIDWLRPLRNRIFIYPLCAVDFLLFLESSFTLRNYHAQAEELLYKGSVPFVKNVK